MQINGTLVSSGLPFMLHVLGNAAPKNLKSWTLEAYATVTHCAPHIWIVAWTMPIIASQIIGQCPVRESVQRWKLRLSPEEATVGVLLDVIRG